MTESISLSRREFLAVSAASVIVASTGELQARVQSFLTDVAKLPQDGVAVTHMGVLRTAYALATGWDMSAPMPDELDLSAALVLSLGADGRPAIDELNAPLRVRR